MSNRSLPDDLRRPFLSSGFDHVSADEPNGCEYIEPSDERVVYRWSNAGQHNDRVIEYRNNGPQDTSASSSRRPNALAADGSDNIRRDLTLPVVQVRFQMKYFLYTYIAPM